MATPELFHFAASHFNEKARWALDYKGIAHVRHSLVPGPHKLRVRRLSGQEQVPVLRTGTEVVAGSARIIDHLERVQPTPSLYPTDPTIRARALEVQAYFDGEVGAAVRLAMFEELLREPAYFVRMFTWDHPLLTRLGYRAAFPAIRILMRRQMQITAENAARARETTRRGFDFVASTSARSGYLAGDAFSVADLAAASLLAPAVELPVSPFRFPEPWPPVLRQWWARWSDHPGAAWVRGIFDRHRGRSSSITALRGL